MQIKLSYEPIFISKVVFLLACVSAFQIFKDLCANFQVSLTVSSHSFLSGLIWLGKRGAAVLFYKCSKDWLLPEVGIGLTVF